MIRKLSAIFWAFVLFFQSILISLPAYAQSVGESVRPSGIEEAAKKSNLVYLGEKIEAKTGRKIKGFMIVHRTKEQVAQMVTEGAITSAVNSACYAFTAEGMKWKNNEGFVVNGANTDGIDPNFIATNHAQNIAKWEDASTGALDAYSQNIVGDVATTNNPLSVDLTSPDGQNEVYFGTVSVSTAIAATTVWGYFDGPVETRELIEADMVFNNVDYDWSATGEVNKMDFENISTHELGHVLGMADIYDSACNTVTMYGYSGNGDTLKRTLEAPDITGIAALYPYVVPPADADGDGVLDANDNCVNAYNPTQANFNSEVFDLGSAVTAFDDATNPIADKIGDACDADMDHDGLSNVEEASAFTNPNVPDTDGDRVLDGAEVVCLSDPLSVTSKPTGIDADRDLLPDHCDPNSSIQDINGDGVPDGRDVDGDRMIDGNEVLYKGTNPLAIDTDNDGCRDDIEVATVNADRTVNAIDLSLVAQRFGSSTSAVYVHYFDFTGDGTINSIDLSQVAQRFGTCP